MRTRLDPTGLYNVAVMNKNSINVYRISITMKAPVNPQRLQKAVDIMVARFPVICCKMVQDNYWCYSEGLDKLEIREDDNNILGSINCENIYKQAVNILYSGNRIVFEAFHSVTDGHGAFVFLNCLLTEYMLLAENSSEKRYWGVPEEYEAEDGYIKYGNVKSQAVNAMNFKKTFTFEKYKPGTKLNFTTIRLKTRRMKNLAKRNECTMNELVLTMIYNAIFSMKNSDGKDAIVLVPIDLRNKFESHSMKNFFYLAKVSVKKGEKTLKDMVKEIRRQIHKQNNKEFLHGSIAKIAKAQENFFVRYSPMWLKKVIMRMAVLLGADKSCMTVSNLGDLSNLMPDAAAGVEYVDIMLSPRRKTPYNCCITSMGDNMNITFTHPHINDVFLDSIKNWLENNSIGYTAQLH